MTAFYQDSATSIQVNCESEGDAMGEIEVRRGGHWCFTQGSGSTGYKYLNAAELRAIASKLDELNGGATDGQEPCES